MQKDITITIEPKDEKNSDKLNFLCFKELDKLNLFYKKEETSFVFVKKSIDARHGKVKLHLRYKAFINEKPEDISKNLLPEWKKATGEKSVIIVGSGPAGLFAALKLLENGIKPIIIERGNKTQDRRKDIAKISTESKVNPDSNYCFGEGGAGTFSDGKLYTRSNKRGSIDKILQIFVHFGADSKILTDAHPHIGTEKLPLVINAMRDFIIQMGGEFHFGTKCVKLLKDTGIIVQNLFTNEEKELHASKVILATGHSANDIYKILAEIKPESLEAKTFACGVRVEHPRELIDSIQFHGQTEGMQAAEYRLTTQVEGRGVYSFCMCPGGFVVPSQTSDDEIVVNGMSASKRNSKWSNAAIVVEVRPEDIPETFVVQAKALGSKALSGLLFRKELEKLTKQNGQGQKAPSQLMTDFISGKDSKQEKLPETSYTPGLVPSRLDAWLPLHISSRLKQGFLDFGKNMKGFITDKAVLIASETRTSTPCRIKRDETSLEIEGLQGFYACGEGSGYSGGIVSSAMDGEKIASQIAVSLSGKEYF